MACPMELAPRQINALLKQEWRAAKTDVKPDVSLSAGRDFWRSYRKIPAARLVERLRLGSFKKFDLPFAGMLEPDLVRIPLQQHIGAAAEACCAVGAKVKTGDLLGDIPATALGARVHASIAGTVISVDSHICIRRTA